MKKTIFLIALAVVFSDCFAQTFTQGSCTYRVLNRTERRVNVRAKDFFITGNLVVPEQVTYEGITYTVTEFDWPTAFGGLYLLNSITIPGTIKNIHQETFYDSQGLTSVIINEGVEAMGNRVFERCYSLKNVVLPNSLVSMGELVFLSCLSLESIRLPKNLSAIGQSAFQGCKSLMSVTLPEKLTYVPPSTFSSCIALENINFLCDSLTRIGAWAFSGCTFKSFVVPKSVTTIEAGAFADCTRLSSIVFPDSILSCGTFRGCTSLTSFVIPKLVTVLGSGMFENCTSLSSIIFPDSLIEIGNFAFAGCTLLKTFSIPSSVEYIGNGAFQNCTSLTSISIPSSVKTIKGKAFYNCTALQSIILPSLITVIEDYTFYYCRSLTSITIPSSVEYIGREAFAESGIYDFYFEPLEAPAIDYYSTPFYHLLEDIHIHIYPGATGYTKEKGWPGIIVEDMHVISATAPVTNGVFIYAADGKVFVQGNVSERIDFYTVTGAIHTKSVTAGMNEFTLPKGVYFVKGKKILVQ